MLNLREVILILELISNPDLINNSFNLNILNQ